MSIVYLVACGISAFCFLLAAILSYWERKKYLKMRRDANGSEKTMVRLHKEILEMGKTYMGLLANRSKASMDKATDHYFKNKPKMLEDMREAMPKRNDLGHILFILHKHDGDKRIVYRESDVLELLKLLGYPVEWGEDGV